MTLPATAYFSPLHTFFSLFTSTFTNMSTTTTPKRPAEEAAAPSEPEPEPPRKKQLRKRLCIVCDAEKGINQFPSPKKVSSHEHDANVCRACYLSHLETEIDSKTWDQVACPECPTTLTYKEVKDMTSAENFAK